MEATRGSGNRTILRGTGLFRQRRLVVLVALLGFGLTWCIAIQNYNKTKYVSTVMPEIFGEPVVMISSHMFLMVLTCKMTWAAGIILASLTCSYETLERIALETADDAGKLVLMAGIFTGFAALISLLGNAGYLVSFYFACLSLEFVYPTLMYIMLIV